MHTCLLRHSCKPAELAKVSALNSSCTRTGSSQRSGEMSSDQDQIFDKFRGCTEYPPTAVRPSEIRALKIVADTLLGIKCAQNTATVCINVKYNNI